MKHVQTTYRDQLSLLCHLLHTRKGILVIVIDVINSLKELFNKKLVDFLNFKKENIVERRIRWKFSYSIQ